MLAASSGVLATLLTVNACATGTTPRAARRPHVDRTVLSRELMLSHHFTTVYDAVAALRSQWLQPRGPESFLLPTVVWVYLDEGRLGTIETLRNIQPGLVATVRFYDGPSATGRWGVGHNAGVIHVSTWATGALGFPDTHPVLPDTASPPDSVSRADSTKKRRRP